jgi:nucleoside-diphosphate-sugar epimerase
LRVLVTGGTGFVGSHLIPRLGDHEVHLLDRYVTGRLHMDEGSSYTHVMDLCDYAKVRGLVTRLKPEVVIHLAAISPVSYSYEHSMEVMEVNALATMNLAEACADVPGFKHMIAAGTTEEYGMTPDRPATEESRCAPNSPYSVAKHAATKYLLYLHMARKFPVTVMRATNTYGRTKDCHFVVEKTVRQMLNGGDVTLGDPYPIRDFMYVDDHVEGYLRAMEDREASIGQIFNLATGRYGTIREWTEQISKALGFKGSVSWNSIIERPLDIQDHRIDWSKAEKVLGWRARTSFEEGITKTAKLLEAVA